LRFERKPYCTHNEHVLKSREIEGEKLDRDQVRSSIARRLGIHIGGLTPADRDVEGVVEMTLDATLTYYSTGIDDSPVGIVIAIRRGEISENDSYSNSQSKTNGKNWKPETFCRIFLFKARADRTIRSFHNNIFGIVCSHRSRTQPRGEMDCHVPHIQISHRS